MRTKVAVTLLFEVTVICTGLVLPETAPDQDLKRYPTFGTAVRVAVSPEL